MKIDKHIYEDLNSTLGVINDTQQMLIACLVYDKESEKLELITDLFNTHARLELTYKRVNSVFHELMNIEHNEAAKEDADDDVKVIREDDPNILKLLTSDDWCERELIAKLGLHLDELMNDTDCDVRKAVVEQGYGLDKLINDDHWVVRKAVAEQCYGLDKLVNDESANVRAAVAEQGYGLEKLVNDDRWVVRKAVAKQGYGLGKLVNDFDYAVRVAAQKKLAELEAGENDE